MWISWKGGHGSFEELQKIKITVTLDRDMMIDEDSIISNLVNLGDEISQETRDELNPYVESHEIEEQRREEDRKKAIENQELTILDEDIIKAAQRNTRNKQLEQENIDTAINAE